MTRAERRRQKRQAKKTATYNFTAEQLHAIHAEWERKEEAKKEEWTQKAVHHSTALLMILPILVLKNEYGWGSKKRLPQFAEYLTDYYQHLVDCPDDVYEFAKQAEAYTGVGFRFESMEEE